MKMMVLGHCELLSREAVRGRVLVRGSTSTVICIHAGLPEERTSLYILLYCGVYIYICTDEENISESKIIMMLVKKGKKLVERKKDKKIRKAMS